jgi:hypothetical protein
MQLQLIFDRTEKTKKEIKELQRTIKDAFVNSNLYNGIVEDLKILKEKKKKIEDSIRDDFGSEISKLETLKIDLKNDQMLLSDMAINKIMEGKTVEVVNSQGQKLSPDIKVKF